MARTKKVAPDTALIAAVKLFWKVGYHSASTRMIEQETGITRFTLQTSYGGKKALFLKALDHYLDLFDTYLLPDLQAGTPEAIASWFETGPRPQGLEDMLGQGCLMINSITEFASSDSDVMARSERFYVMMRTAFRNALDMAQKAQTIRDDIDIDHSAELLLANAVALHIALRSSVPSAQTDKLRAAAGTLVREWAKPT